MNCDKIITDKNCTTIVKLEPFEEGYVYIYVLQLNNEDNKISKVFFREKEEDEVIFTIAKDGYYTLCSIKITTDENSKYFYKEGNIYFKNNIISLQELIELNPAYTGVSIVYDQYFQICKLKKCYIKICQEIFEQRAPSSRCLSSNVDKNLIYKRDLIWMAINIIGYMVEFGQFEEAQRLLNNIGGCNGLCDEPIGGCGCK